MPKPLTFHYFIDNQSQYSPQLHFNDLWPQKSNVKHINEKKTFYIVFIKSDCFKHVLSTMFNTSLINTKTNESSTNAHPRNVYCSIFDWIFSGEKTLHNM